MSAQRIPDADPFLIHLVPLTSTVSGFHSAILSNPDGHNGLSEREPSAAAVVSERWSRRPPPDKPDRRGDEQCRQRE